ncbi:hypothetical protein A8C56_10065 [Niabella ginsenosidivorans]|uniref:Uncharacterized protein n=1 Tax=Niabella ginsenosidivorans TaxID=1176587 RepID=A0A1A9I1T2_9BACT|nr:hypothetical protein [Niabella ginsenosidivorans]ANH81285.1 hypothetical protein A8C56_10065 [Niabella ginsenosidivorans]
MNNSIFFHEDFYRQIELIPEENYFGTRKDIDQNFIQEEPSKYGFINITERKEQAIKTEVLRIHMDIIENVLSPFTIKKFDTVITGYNKTEILKENIMALGFERFALFFETKLNIVNNIWMSQSADLPRETSNSKLLQALTILGKQFKLILVDWNEEIVVRLSSTTTLQHYLKENFAFDF